MSAIRRSVAQESSTSPSGVQQMVQSIENTQHTFQETQKHQSVQEFGSPKAAACRSSIYTVETEVTSINEVQSPKSQDVMTSNSIVSKSSVGEYLICNSNDKSSNELYDGIYMQQWEVSDGKLSKDVNFFKKQFSVGSSLQVHGYIEPTANRIAFDFCSKKIMEYVEMEEDVLYCPVKDESRNEIIKERSKNTGKNSATQHSNQELKELAYEKPKENRIKTIERKTINDIVFHLNPRFNENKVVRNTLKNDVWGQEEVSGGLPLKRGSNFFLRINCEDKGYRVFIDEKEFVFYEHRIQPSEITGLEIHGAVNLYLVLHKAVIKDEVKKNGEIEEEKN